LSNEVTKSRFGGNESEKKSKCKIHKVIFYWLQDNKTIKNARFQEFRNPIRCTITPPYRHTVTPPHLWSWSNTRRKLFEKNWIPLCFRISW